MNLFEEKTQNKGIRSQILDPSKCIIVAQDRLRNIVIEGKKLFI